VVVVAAVTGSPSSYILLRTSFDGILHYGDQVFVPKNGGCRVCDEVQRVVYITWSHITERC